MSPKAPTSDATERVRRLLLIDGTNSIYRAFFAIPGLRAPDGTPTNAALGFINMLSKVIREEQPTGVVVVFDARGKTFRHELFGEYKAGRDAQPEDLTAQFPIVKELVEAHAIPIVEVAGVEADDVIATLATSAPSGTEVRIVSTDKDLMQLVSEHVELLDGIKDRRYQPADVEERFGVPPGRVLDLRSLVGDPSDNIPGVKGIGAKGAAKLIEEWETLENLLDHVDEVAPKRAQTALSAHMDDARLSKQLSTLRTDVELPLDPATLSLEEPDRDKLRELYTRYGFTRLLDALDADETEGGAGAPLTQRVDIAVERVVSAKALDALVDALGKLPAVALVPVLRGAGSLDNEALGVAAALEGDNAAFVPFAEAFGGDNGLPANEVLDRFGSLFATPARVAWMGAETKRTQLLFAESGVELALPYFDVEIAGHLLDAGGVHTLPALAQKYLGASLVGFEDIAGKGKKALPTLLIPSEELATFAGEQARAVRDLQPVLAAKLDADGLSELFDEVELPLSRVLARMERSGVRIDEAKLAELSVEYGDLLEQIVTKIHELAGEKFLVSSPKQLQTILFEKLKLRVVKKTKTGYSTDEDVLEQLAADHELPSQVLAWRRLSKLKSTYVDALPPLVNETTGRVHPTFNQLGAATGRLSATNPNVQNIPIRTEEGIRIREAFIPRADQLLLSADYSQVELRILAHYSEDENLIAAFRDGEDIHRRTAAEVQGIGPEDVTADQRARAKAVNFGIIYGSSAFGLARQLGIASADAQETIDAYFERYRGVRRFLDETVEIARERGFVQTLLGRRRYLPDLGSRNRVQRNAAERMAVNTVIQGTAADLIKKAMIAVDARLAESGLGARMILQVHDELVFEVPAGGLDALAELVREQMENVLSLRVPLLVDVGTGSSWREAH